MQNITRNYVLKMECSQIWTVILKESLGCEGAYRMVGNPSSVVRQHFWPAISRLSSGWSQSFLIYSMPLVGHRIFSWKSSWNLGCYGNHKVSYTYIGKMFAITITPIVLIRCTRKFQIRRTWIKSRQNSKTSQIGSLILELRLLINKKHLFEFTISVTHSLLIRCS